MIEFKKIVATGLCASVLASCHEESTQSPVPQEPASAELAAQVIARTCLATLPNFAGFEQAASSAGLVLGSAVGPARKPYYVLGKTMFVATVDSPAGKACVASVRSSDSKEAVGNAVLAVARAAGGKGSERRLPTNFYEFAVQLPNGSLVTQDFRSAPGKAEMNIIGVTGPVNDAEIAMFIYN